MAAQLLATKRSGEMESSAVVKQRNQKMMSRMIQRQVQRMMLTLALSAMTAFVLPDRTAQAGPILDRITRAGVIRCGVSEGIPGFSIAREGRWQ